MSATTDRETDASWDIFIIWKINSGLWAGLDWTVEKNGPIMSQPLRPIFFTFSGENTTAFVLKSCIILFFKDISKIFLTPVSEKNSFFFEG